MLTDHPARFVAVARALAATVSVISIAALAGWLLDVPVLRRPLPTTAPMSPFTAIVVCVVGLAVLLLASARRRERQAGRLAAAVGGALGVIGISDQVTSVHFDLSRHVFGTDVRMALTTAVALTALSVGLCVIDFRGRPRRLARAAALLAAAIGTAGIAGYSIGVEYFYGPDRSVQMAPQAALSVLLLAAATAALRPGPFLGLMVSPTLGGRFARTFLPLLAVVQIATGAVATLGATTGLYSLNAAVWLTTLMSLACLTALVAWAALHIHADDLRRADDARRLTELAARDPLTGGLNRRAFDTEIERAADHARRYGTTGAVAVIDLDRFKDINDTYGHGAGDDTLVRVYRALRSRLRSTDVLGRIGGDEFAALLPQADDLAAQRVAGELADVVREVADELTAEGRPNRLRASVGVAPMTGEETPSELLERADERMYAAKRAARA